jgi:hypothetical protein
LSISSDPFLATSLPSKCKIQKKGEIFRFFRCTDGAREEDGKMWERKRAR